MNRLFSKINIGYGAVSFGWRNAQIVEDLIKSRILNGENPITLEQEIISEFLTIEVKIDWDNIKVEERYQNKIINIPYTGSKEVFDINHQVISSAFQLPSASFDSFGACIELEYPISMNPAQMKSSIQNTMVSIKHYLPYANELVGKLNMLRELEIKKYVKKAIKYKSSQNDLDDFLRGL